MILRTLLVCLLLFGCTKDQGVTASFHDWTGFHRWVTPEYEIFRDRSGIMVVRAVMLQHDANRTANVGALAGVSGGASWQRLRLSQRVR